MKVFQMIHFEAIIMNDVNFIMKNVALFAGVSEGIVKALVADAGTRRRSFEKGEALCRRDGANDDLIVILSGKAEVRKGSVVMRVLRAGDVTGVSTLFGGDGVMDSDVTAQTKLTALFFNRSAVLTAVRSDPALAENYIRFLSSRVRFLNGVISRCAGADSAGKLARYVAALAAQNGGRFALNVSRAAAELSLGRATVYRALDALVEAGCVERDGRFVVVKDAEKLKDAY